MFSSTVIPIIGRSTLAKRVPDEYSLLRVAESCFSCTANSL